MKKVLFLIALLFTVVCYAAPPPDVGLITDTEHGISMLQVVASDVPVFCEQKIEAQEVAMVYRGDMEIFTGTDIKIKNALATKTEQIGLPVKYSNNSFEISGLNGPPLCKTNAGLINHGSGFESDKQNSNYGYPKSAN